MGRRDEAEQAGCVANVPRTLPLHLLPLLLFPPPGLLGNFSLAYLLYPLTPHLPILHILLFSIVCMLTLVSVEPFVQGHILCLETMQASGTVGR